MSTEAMTTDELRAAVADANVPALLATLYQLTRDERFLSEPYRTTRAKGPGDHDSGGLSDPVLAQLRDEAATVLSRALDGRLPAIAPLTPDEIVGVLERTLAEPVPIAQGPMLAEELGIVDRHVEPPTRRTQDHSVLIIGGGYSGICAAIQLGRTGIRYVLIEADEDIGGTWVQNTYPGCGVDTPVHLYSFSFAQNPDWPSYFAKQSEVREYLNAVATRHGVREHTRLKTTVERCDYDAAAAGWDVTLRTADGNRERIQARVVISAVGLLNVPSTPSIPGLETFEGPTLHTARWRHDVDIEGRRVGVIGTGASAMQLVPAIADEAARVVVFQRSPQWAFPNPNYRRPVSPEKRWLMRNVPAYQRWYRLRQLWMFGDRPHAALQIDESWPHFERSINAVNERHREYLTSHIERELDGRPDLLPKCLPTYPVYGKRPLIDNGWYATMRRDDVALVTSDVADVRPNGVACADGTEFELDVLVLATGFQSLRILGSFEVCGRSGRRLREVWGDDDARAYMGMTIPDLPNFFCLFGPNTNSGHGGSHVLSVEMQVRYVVQLLVAMEERDIASVEVREEVFEDYNARLDRALASTIWTHPGMTTYYRNSRGRIVTNIPYPNSAYREMTLRPDLGDFVCERAAARSAA